MNDDADVSSSSYWFSPRRFALLLALLIVVSFPWVLSGARTFVARDFGLFGYPLAFFHKECFWRGEAPLWNPYSCCGMPFLAEWNTLTCYPPSLIYLLFPLTWSLPLFCLAHFFMGGLGMYFLARRWTGSRFGGALAGVTVAFNGLSLNFLLWPNNVAAFCWMPWLVLLAEDAWLKGGRKIILASLVAALQILAGGPEIILLTWFVLTALAAVQLCRKAAPMLTLAWRFMAVGVVAFGLAAVQMLPFLDLVANAHRDTGYARSEWAMPPSGWANFLLPLFGTYAGGHTVAQVGQAWTSSYYAGIGVLFLVVMALWRQRQWRVWLVGGIFLLSLILAQGDDAYLYGWLRRFVPIFGFFRFPVKFVVLTIWAMPLLAAFAICHYEKRGHAAPASWRLEFGCAGTMVLVIAGLLWFAREFPVGNVSWSRLAANGAGRIGALGLALAAIYFFARQPKARRWSKVALLAVLWLDAVTHIPWQNRTVDPSVYQPDMARRLTKLNPEPNVAESRLMMSPPAAREVMYKGTDDPQETYLLERIVFMSDCNLLDHIPKVDGFFSLYLRHMDRLVSLFDEKTEPKLHKLEDLLGVSQTIEPGKVFDWMPRSTYLPIVTAGQEPVFANDDVTLYAVTQSDVDFRKVVYLPAEARHLIKGAKQADAKILSKRFTNERDTSEIETPAPTMAFISQAFHHNWKAYVDGQATQLWRGNYAFQAVEIPAGHHELVLAYEDRAFKAGAVISVITLLGCAIGWFWPKRVDS